MEVYESPSKLAKNDMNSIEGPTLTSQELDLLKDGNKEEKGERDERRSK